MKTTSGCLRSLAKPVSLGGGITSTFEITSSDFLTTPSILFEGTSTLGNSTSLGIISPTASPGSIGGTSLFLNIVLGSVGFSKDLSSASASVVATPSIPSGGASLTSDKVSFTSSTVIFLPLALRYKPLPSIPINK